MIEFLMLLLPGSAMAFSWFSFSGPAVVPSCFPFTGPATDSLSFPFPLVVQSKFDFIVVVAVRTENPGQRSLFH